MDNPFHYDPAAYRAQVVHIARRVVANDDAIPTVARPFEVECNSYHGAAIREAERQRLSGRDPQPRH